MHKYTFFFFSFFYVSCLALSVTVSFLSFCLSLAVCVCLLGIVFSLVLRFLPSIDQRGLKCELGAGIMMNTLIMQNQRVCVMCMVTVEMGFIRV